MITRIEALNYRCLRDISVPLSRFHVLVGPNASGKTTFLDVMGFLKDLVTDDIGETIAKRTTNPEELLFGRAGTGFELAVEVAIPNVLRKKTSKPEFDTARYELRVGFDETEKQFEIKEERFLIKLSEVVQNPVQRDLFPAIRHGKNSIISTRGNSRSKTIIKKSPGGNDNFYSEVYHESGKGWTPSFKLGSQKSALRNLPADETALPVATWFREFISSGVQPFMLNSMALRKPSPPTKIKGFLPDGSNLPWVINRFRDQSPNAFTDWLAHLQTALPDLTDIQTVERPEDKHCYLVFRYASGLAVPSWLVSDGTLRLTALTLPAYLGNVEGVYLIEEPENGIHPNAVSAAYDSLSSVYSAQVLLATHSTVVLNSAKPEDILCFAKNTDGSTDIVSGIDHPRLKGWKGNVNLGSLLASGVLG